MRRVTLVLLVLFPMSVLWAAPAPRPFQAGWDKPLDPDGDCKFKRDKDTLTIELPGTDHDYYPLRDRINTPRLLREIEGDFDMRVRVHIDCRPATTSTVKDWPSLVAAGFLVIPPPTYNLACVRLEFGVAGQGRDADGYAAMRHQSTPRGRMDARWGREWKDWTLREKADRAYLRLLRRGRFLYPSISSDGRKWALLVGGAGYIGLPEKLKIGLAAYSTSSAPSKVRFDHFELIQGKKKAD